MIDYANARRELRMALLAATLDSPEWTQADAALAALNEAQAAEGRDVFNNAARSIADATARLQAIVDGVSPDSAAEFLEHITAALEAVGPIAQTVAEARKT